MRDYWLSKLFFDLQSSPPLGAQYRVDRTTVLDRYPLTPEVRSAVERNDVAFLAPRVNAYLLRFYFVVTGMPEAEFLSKVRTAGTPNAATARHG